MTAAQLGIRAIRGEEINIAIDWAAAEGWNPGLSDAQCFAKVDPGGFLVGAIMDEPIAIISCVVYDDRFAFLGFYMVRSDMRGRGYGLEMWRAACEHAGDRTIGLDGVLAQQDAYRKSGFVFSHRNIRFGRLENPTRGENPRRPVAAGIVPLGTIPLARLAEDDRRVFPAARAEFLRRWVNAPGHVGCAFMRDGDLVSWGVVRPCRSGSKIGPLIANDAGAAGRVLDALLANAEPGPVFIDIPEANAAALALARDREFVAVFETARMYKGLVPQLESDRIFGVTSFELG
jgi:GNAT superfamily N-acetyltransferase